MANKTYQILEYKLKTYGIYLPDPKWWNMDMCLLAANIRIERKEEDAICDK